MGKKLRGVFAASAAVALGLSLAACGGGSESDSNADAEGEKGGTLRYLATSPVESTDPQRIYYGYQLASFRRTLYRGLVAFPMSEDQKEGNTPVADLATDTGTPNEDSSSWTFTIKDGVKWDDGSDITCEDFRYGASRVFANDVITGGPNYTLSYLDVPQKDGKPTYPGPYKATPEQQAEFDKAIECNGKEITYNFNKPWADFPLAAAGMMMTDPYKESFDEGAKSTWKVLSNGPYKIEGGVWDKNKGATFVRNEHYDEATDSPEELRLALPDTIEWQISGADDAAELVNDRLIANAGDDQYAVTSGRVPSSMFSQLEGPVEERYLNVESPYVSYLVPNAKKMTNLKVRQALAVSTNLEGYVKALGGERAATPAESLINPAVPGYQDNPAFEGDNAGDIEAAKKLLEESGEKLPYPLKITYNSTPTADAAMAVLADTWKKAGFAPKLDPLTDTYYDVIAKPEKDSDVMWGGWGSDWPSIGTVAPPLFDSRPNISATNCNNDYGCYHSDKFNAKIDEAANATDLDAQVKAYQESDAILGEEIAYIPLEITKFNWLHGSKVTGFTTTPASSSYPELGLIGVEQ